MLGEAEQAGLTTERHLRSDLTDGGHARIHRSRVKVFRLRPAQDRPLHHAGILTSVHPSVRERFEGDTGYRPRNLLELLETRGGWEDVVER